MAPDPFNLSYIDPFFEADFLFDEVQKVKFHPNKQAIAMWAGYEIAEHLVVA